MTGRWFAIVVVAIALGLAVFAAPFASTAPDGLQRVAMDHGFARHAATSYGPGARRAAGTLVVILAGGAVSTVLLRRRRRI